MRASTLNNMSSAVSRYLVPGCWLAVVLLCYGCPSREGAAKGPGGGKKGGGDVPVTVAKVAQKGVPIEAQVIGTAEAYATITVKSQISGQLTKALFREGDYVKENDLLFTIDRRPLEAQLRQYEATLLKNQAQLRQSQANLAKDSANLEYARVQASRASQLAAQGIFAKEQNDQAKAAADAAEQAVLADKAAIESAQAESASTAANIESVKVQLGYTEIRSPINGRTGNLNVKPGNIVTANTSDLITINQVQPIYVSFSVPEAQLTAIKAAMAAGPLQVTAAPQGEKERTAVGRLTFVDNAVDASTGTIRLKGTFPNADRSLWPGEFLRVTLRLAMRTNAVVAPNQAVQTGQDGTYVYVVKPDRTVEARPVTVGARVDQDLIIDKGLEAGETIVLEGQLRLAPGMRVALREGGGRKGGKGKGGPGGGAVQAEAGGQGGPGQGGAAPQAEAAAGATGEGGWKGKGGKGKRGKSGPPAEQE